MIDRILYNCFNAHVLGDKIYCTKGYKLGSGRLTILRLLRGEPLRCDVCQDCPDHDTDDINVGEYDRGWIDEDVSERRRG